MLQIRFASAFFSGAIGLAVIAVLPAHAAGKYDGTWIIDVPATMDGDGRNPTCAALRFPLEVKDNLVGGSLERIYAGGYNVVERGYDSNATPISGSVQADGTVTFEWEGYHVAGTFGEATGTLTIKGACGPRVSKAVRVQSAGNAVSQ